MTNYNAAITDYTAGDSLRISVPVIDMNETPYPLSGGTVRWVLVRRPGGEPVVEKTTDDDVEITDPDGGELVVNISGEETEDLSGQWHHEAELTDADGGIWTLFSDTFRIRPDSA